jgi:hypothetical protein
VIVKTSTLRAEFIALKVAVEMIEAWHYKLHMFGISIDGSANIFCDKPSVVTNSYVPESTLKEEQNAIACHCVHEAVQ